MSESRQLHDLGNILSNLHRERLEDSAERDSVVKGLATWPVVLHATAQKFHAQKEMLQEALSALEGASPTVATQQAIEGIRRVLKD